uniref:CDC42 effector protein 1 n=1 Tax=Ornithorhynchus anatinus TaxID=9258 RepID=F6TPT9_ORNAN
MSLGKLPMLGWVSGSHGKRKPRAELTSDMISPPLGDFRHTMHVGRGGDVFGDTSFLSNHGGGGGSAGPDGRSPGSFLARTLRHVRRGGAPPRGGMVSASSSPAPPSVSPIIKNAISLPQLHESAYDGVIGKLSFGSPHSGSPLQEHLGYDQDSRFRTISSFPRSEKPLDRDGSFPSEPELRRSDSLLSFRLDLGPSLLSELLGTITFSEPPSTGETGQPPTSSSPPATPPAPGAPAQGHCPNGDSAGTGSLGGGGAGPPPQREGESGALDPGSRGRWSEGWAPGRHYSEMGARRELAEVLPQGRGSWESQDEGPWGPGCQTGPRFSVPATVQADSFEFAGEEEEEEEVKV